MSDQNKWDSIIKERLGNYTDAPPAYMWDKIATGIGTTPVAVVFYKTATFKISMVAASVLLMLSLAWIFLPSDTASNSKLEVQNSTVVPFKTVQDINSINQKANSSTQDKIEFSESNTPENTNSSQKVLTQKTLQTESSEKPIPRGENSPNQNNGIAVTNNSTSKQTSTPVVANVIAGSNLAETQENKKQNTNTPSPPSAPIENTNQQITPIIAIENKVNENSNPDITSGNSTIDTISQAQSSTLVDNKPQITEEHLTPIGDFNPKTRVFNSYGVGIHYGMEFIKLDNLTIKSNNIDLSFNYQNLNFIFQTGIGLQFSQDQSAYQMEYASNEYLDTETRFDSAIFVIDSTGTAHLVPVNPYQQDIYDSVNHDYASSLYDSYLNIRIPLMVGYQKDFKKFGMFVKGGIFYSLLVNKNSGKMYEVDESSKITSINYDEYIRRTSQIEYVMSAGMTYRLNKKLHLHTEVMGKFYQSSLYENTIYSNLNPWSIEGRLGLVYFLN